MCDMSSNSLTSRGLSHLDSMIGILLSHQMTHLNALDLTYWTLSKCDKVSPNDTMSLPKRIRKCIVGLYEIVSCSTPDCPIVFNLIASYQEKIIHCFIFTLNSSCCR
jgi:hypothetical protein